MANMQHTQKLWKPSFISIRRKAQFALFGHVKPLLWQMLWHTKDWRNTGFKHQMGDTKEHLCFPRKNRALTKSKKLPEEQLWPLMKVFQGTSYFICMQQTDTSCHFPLLVLATVFAPADVCQHLWISWALMAPLSSFPSKSSFNEPASPSAWSHRAQFKNHYFSPYYLLNTFSSSN